MSPLRRYLRISSHSVLEVRIYLDNPTDATRWLLSPREPMLGRIMEAVRPLVLPKLKEENDRARGRGKGKGAKKKGVRDVVVTDDFEVSIFLTELSSRHSILKKEKTFMSNKGRMKSNSAKMTGTREVPVEVVEEEGEEEAHRSEGLVRRESTDEDGAGLSGVLHSIPSANHDVVEEEGEEAAAVSRKAKEGHDESLFLSENSEDSDFEKMPTPKRAKATNPPAMMAEEEEGEAGELQDDKKKAAFNTTYDGYSIYGRILCLIVKRKGQKGKSAVGGGAGQAMMEEWITSTQALEEGGMMDD